MRIHKNLHAYTENPRVGGSNPPLGTSKIKELGEITTHTESLLATK